MAGQGTFAGTEGDRFVARVLLIEDNPADALLLRECLNDFAPGQFSLVHVDSAGAAAMKLSDELFDIALLDLSLPDSVGVDAMKIIQEKTPELPIVVLTGCDDEEMATAAIRAGAQDYLVKGRVGGRTLVRSLKYSIDRKKAQKDYFKSSFWRFFSPHCPGGVPIVGQSPGVSRMLETIRMIARSRCNPILLVGETGTGKEMAAQAVHVWRCDSDAPFVAINCAALTATLLESELFGHVKGSFTGADREKVGLLEMAANGTIFLDEVSEIVPELQAKLLRVLQERVFRKVGGTKNIECTATIVASSNRDLLKEVEAGRFRRDLYYRLAVFPVHLPPLRSPDRRSDIPVLAEYFAETTTICEGGPRRISRQALEMLMAHDWPGNIRELKNVIERAIIVERSREITPASLMLGTDVSSPAASPVDMPHQSAQDQYYVSDVGSPVTINSDIDDESDAGDAESQIEARAQQVIPGGFSLEAAERELIIRALQETGWQRTRAAAMLGITRATLHAKLKRYEIKVPDKCKSEACNA